MHKKRATRQNDLCRHLPLISDGSAIAQGTYIFVAGNIAVVDVSDVVENLAAEQKVRPKSTTPQRQQYLRAERESKEVLMMR